MYRVYSNYSDGGKEKENGSYESENRVWGLRHRAWGLRTEFLVRLFRRLDVLGELGSLTRIVDVKTRLSPPMIHPVQGS